jgi:hypothetical protein
VTVGLPQPAKTVAVPKTSVRMRRDRRSQRATLSPSPKGFLQLRSRNLAPTALSGTFSREGSPTGGNRTPNHSPVVPSRSSRVESA